MSPRSLLVILGALAAVACGPSPAMPAHEPVVVVAQPVVVVTDEDDEDEDDTPPPPRKVEYVRMTEWQPTPSVQRIESEIAPRGSQPATYIQFPQLKLHRPIPRYTWY